MGIRGRVKGGNKGEGFRVGKGLENLFRGI